MLRPSHHAGALLAVGYVIGLLMLMTAGIYDGPLAEPSIFLAVVCCGVVCAALAGVVVSSPLSRVLPPRWAPSRFALLLLAAALGVFAIAIFADARLLIHGPNPAKLIHAIEIVQIGLLATYARAIVRDTPESNRWAHLRFACFAVLFLAGGASVMHLSPHPEVDVWQMHTEAARAMLEGKNVYDIANVHVGDQGRNGLLIAFPYPPTPCFLSAAAYALGRDVRWGVLAAMLVSGIAMRWLAMGGKAAEAAPGTRRWTLAEDAPALVWWLSPKAFFFLEIAFNDAYPLAFVALALLAHRSGRRTLSALLLGLALSAKQTMIWFAPIAVLLGYGAVQWIVFLGSAAATVVPFAVWDFHALKHAAVDYYFTFPSRTNALSPMAWLHRRFHLVQGVVPPGLVLGLTAAGIAVLRAPRTRYAFVLAATCTCFCFYLFNRFMVINYYFFVMGLALLAAAIGIGER